MIRVHQENNLLHRFLQMQRPENLQGMKYVMGGKYIMNRPYTRAHIRLNSQNEVIDFISALSKFEDSFVIEDSTGKHRVNAKSVIGVMYTMLDFPEEMFLVNETNDGHIPSFVDSYRPVESQLHKIA